jgi:hypothetical protein
LQFANDCSNALTRPLTGCNEFQIVGLDGHSTSKSFIERASAFSKRHSPVTLG